MKRCSKCGTLKDESMFPKDRTRKDGLHQRCKECKNAYSRNRYQASHTAREEDTEDGNLKKCSGCGELKERSEYSRDRTKKDGFYHLCKDCRSKYRRKSKEARMSLHDSGPSDLSDKALESDNGEVGLLAIVYSGDEYGACSICGKSLVGYIPGYIHGQPVCRDCVVFNLKTVFKQRQFNG